MKASAERREQPGQQSNKLMSCKPSPKSIGGKRRAPNTARSHDSGTSVCVLQGGPPTTRKKSSERSQPTQGVCRSRRDFVEGYGCPLRVGSDQWHTLGQKDDTGSTTERFFNSACTLDSPGEQGTDWSELTGGMSRPWCINSTQGRFSPEDMAGGCAKSPLPGPDLQLHLQGASVPPPGHWRGGEGGGRDWGQGVSSREESPCIP